eukprot:1992779-Pleurochrysis_carterae.AAC.2
MHSRSAPPSPPCPVFFYSSSLPIGLSGHPSLHRPSLPVSSAPPPDLLSCTRPILTHGWQSNRPFPCALPPQATLEYGLSCSCTDDDCTRRSRRVFTTLGHDAWPRACLALQLRVFALTGEHSVSDAALHAPRGRRAHLVRAARDPRGCHALARAPRGPRLD